LNSIFLRRRFSLNILSRMIVLALIGAGVVVWKMDFILDVYFRNQLTATGYLINGAIAVLFLIGLLKMIATFLIYSREENAVMRFVANLEKQPDDPISISGISEHTLIARRFRTMERLHRANTPINQSALAATLVASESTRNSFPKFINNILILTGVFGTIVSLSIALLGASDLLESSVAVSGMGMVVHGMSTALSTTITAIVCYLYFGYFYMKLTDVQTNLVSGIEQVTTSHLVPRFQVQTDSVLYEFTGLIRSLQVLVKQMEQSQRIFEQVEKRLVGTLDSYRERIQGVGDDLSSIKSLLKHGFRLPETDA